MSPAAVGLLSRSDGSSRFRYGGSLVLCSVVGPVEVRRKQQERVQEAYLDIHVQPLDHPGNVEERRVEQILRETLSAAVLLALYPRTTIAITVQVLECGGADDAGQGTLLAACINAAVMALLDAGIPMDRHLAAICLQCTAANKALTILHPQSPVVLPSSSFCGRNAQSELSLYTAVLASTGRHTKVALDDGGQVLESLDPTAAPSFEWITLVGDGRLTQQQESTLLEEESLWAQMQQACRDVCQAMRKSLCGPE